MNNQSEAEKQEPVAWANKELTCFAKQETAVCIRPLKWARNYTHPQPKAEKQEPVATWIGNFNEPMAFKCGDAIVHIKPPIYGNTHPQPKHFQPQDWSLLEATQESLREHMQRIKELETQLAAQPKQKQDGSLINEGTKTKQELEAKL